MEQLGEALCYKPEGPDIVQSWGRLNQEYFSGGKDDRCAGLRTLQPSRADYLDTLGDFPSLYRDCFTFNTWTQTA